MFLIAQNTIREMTRNKFFSLILFLWVVFILLSFLLETLALGELKRMLYDFGLSFIEITGLAVVLFLGGGMLAREIEGRTIYLMLSKPIGRGQIFLGKFFGFALVMLFMVAFQSLILLGLLTLKDIAIDPLFFWAILGIILKLFSLLAVILFFTNLTSPLIAMFLTLATYIIGHSGYTMLDYALHRWDTNVLYFAKWILVLFPNLEALNLKNYIATDAPIELSKWLISYWAGTFYIVILLSIWAYIFSKKSFDNA